jgi:hypothetical protein
MLLFSPNWLFLFPGILMVLVGALVSAILIKTPVYVDHVRLSVDTLIYAAFLIITGYQSALFAVLSRTFAVQEGLYPIGRADQYVFRHLNLERGLVAGLVLVIGGLTTAVLAFHKWIYAGFGPLDFEQIARIVIPSGLMITLGAETVLFSFFLSTLGINVRHYSVEAQLQQNPAELTVA